MALPDEQIIKNAEGGIPDPTTTPFVTYPSKFSAAPLNIGPLGGGGGVGDGSSSVLNTAMFLTNPIEKNSRLNSGSFVTYNPNDIDLSGRYNRWVLGADNEDLSGKLQSGWDQAANGLLKGLGIAGTTFLQGTVGLVYGLGAAIGEQKLNKFYNNDFSNFMADLNKSMETSLPNYYTAVERNANWYDPENLFTANFFWDKIIKNLGFSVGALGSGAAVAGVLSKVPTLFGLSKAGMIGKVNAALEQGLAGVPQIERAAKAQSIIMQQAKTINAIEKLTAVERGVVAGLAAATEGGIEALQGLNDYRDKLIEQYKDTFGVSPTGDALNAINEKAEDLGNARFGLNMLLLTGTNYIQIPRILGGSYSAGRNNFVNAVRNNFETGTLSSALPTRTFPKLLYQAKNVGSLFFSPTEGFEEGAQYAIEKGVEAYYNKKDYSKDQSLNEFINSFSEAAGEGIKRVADKEGMESVLIGALSGGIQQAGFVGTYRTPDGKTSIGFGKSGELAERGFTGYGGALAKNTTELMKAGSFTLKGDSWLKDNIAATKRAVVLQDEFEKQVRQGDFLEAKDNQFDYQHNYLTPRIKYGRFDLVQDDINFYRSAGATQEGLDELKQKGIASELDTIESFGLRLNNFENHAKLVKTLQETYKLTYGSLVDKATSKPLYSDEAIDKMVYATAKIADYDRRIPEISANLLDAGINVEEIVQSILTGKPEAKQLTEDALSKIAGIETPGLSEELTRDLTDVTELSLRRKLFLKDYNDIKDNPLKYTTKEATPANPTATGEAITIKTATGEKQVIVGERYIGGSKEVKTNEGVTINRFTEFDVMGTNDKGGIVIKTLDGRIHNITAKAFEEYGLVKSSEINRNGKFYVDNSDKIFNYRFKGGKEAKGYIVYDRSSRGIFFESIEKKKNGKPLYRIPVNLNQFSPQGQFTRAQIWSDEKFSEATESLLQEAPTQEEVNIATNLEQKLNARRAIIKEISDNTKEQIEAIDKKIVSKKEELAKLNEELEELGAFRKKDKYSNVLIVADFSKIYSRSMKGLTKLAGLKTELEKEISELEGTKLELEANLSYLQDFLQSLEELPENTFELVEELKSQVGNLESLSVSTGVQINQFSKMVDDINDTLKDLTSWLKSALQKFDTEYPADIREKIQSILDSKSISFLEINDLKNSISDYIIIQDLKKEISMSDEKLSEIRSKIDGLYNQLTEIGREQRAKELILNKFEELVKREVKRFEEEKALAKNEAVINQILGTMNQGVQNKEYQRAYEPDARMSAVAAATSTSAPSEKSAKDRGEVLAEHHYRANRFGARMPSMSNAGEIKGVLVTANTEDQILPGLTNHLKQGKEEIKAETTIALVMAIPNKDGKTYTLVDENGAPIAERAENESNEDYQNRVLNSAIYQTFPINIESRFRDTVSQEARMKLVNSYDEWRKEKLAETTLKNYDVRPSFGFTQKVQQPTKDGLGFETDYNARVAIQDSGLIKESELGARQLVYVPTTEETIALGSTSFTNAVGRTFFVGKNGYVPLNNRQHTAQEAETIHQVLVRLAEVIAEDNKKGGFSYDNSLEAQRLVNWLRTVTYWGTPKANAGYNSVWFEKTDDGLKLFMSGKTDAEGKNIPIASFTGTALTENKGIIVGALQRMYLNTNARATSKDYYGERYEQITGINADGGVSFVMWPNYQSYLLSKKNPDGTTRKGEDIPLTTNIRPLKNEEDVNKEGIYFTIDEKNIDKRFTDAVAEAKPVVINPEGKTAPKGKFTLDGKTENAVPVFSGEVELGKVRFTADESDLDGSVKILASTDESLINALTEKMEADGKVADMDAVFNTLTKFVLKKIREDLAAVTQQQAPVAEPAAAPKAPGKYNLNGEAQNTVTLKNGSFVFTADEKDIDGTIKIVSAEDSLVNSLIEAQIANGQAADRDVILNTLASFAINEAKKDVAARTAPATTAAVLQPNVSSLAQAQGTARTEPVVTAAPVSDKKADVILPIGTSGSGKSTFIKSLPQENLVVISPDDMRVEFTGDINDKSKDKEIYIEAAKRAIQAIKDGKQVVFDTTNLTKEKRRPFIEAIKKAIPTANIQYKLMELNPELAKQRIKADIAAGKNRANVSDENIDRQAGTYKQMLEDIKSESISEYDAELDALKGAKPAEGTVTKDEAQQLNDAWNATEGNPDNPEEYRVVLDDNYTETEDFAKFEEFLKRALPTVPVYRVKNMLRGANGVRAMGMFKKAAIYLWESAEVGTGYHEVFEAVWKMFTTPREQKAIRNEFRNRTGQFKDRPSGQMVKYSEATDQQIKEQLAEEFRSYIKDGVIPPKPTKAKPFILKLFADIWSMIKAFVTGSNAQSNTERLFEKINKGYYKRYTGLESAMSYANAGIIDIEDATITDDAELSEIPGFTNSEIHDFMQQMTFLAVGYLTRDNKSLFNVSSDLTKSDVYGKVQANLMETFKKISNIEKERLKKGEITQEAADQKEADMRSLFNKMLLNWDGLIEAHEIYLRKYGIEFDENDDMNVRDENRTGRGEYDGSHKVDHFKKMGSAVRLVLATMPILDNNGKPVLSPIGGVKLMPVGETYISIMNRVYDSIDADDMIDRIREMAKEDTNYETLYRRLAKTSSENPANWDAMEADDIKLVTAFSSQFTKQNPEVKVLNILPMGGVQVGDANVTSASRQLEREYVNGIKTVALKPGNKFFEYDFKQQAYIAKKKAFDNVKLTEDPATYIKFLADIGIEFDINDIINLSITNGVAYGRFREATAAILKSFRDGKRIVSFTDQALDIKGRLLTLAGIQARISNPEFASTFYGVGGEKLQTFIGTNPSFDLYKELSKFPTYESLNGHPRFGYLYTDSFAQNSVILNAIFSIDKTTKTGPRRERAESKEYMKPGIANGTIDQADGKKKESGRLNFKERLVQEINMNLDGYYYNLVAGDASLEYMTYMGNEIKNEDLDPGKTTVQEIFKGYLIDEINLARENRPTVKESDSDKLRFMDAILGNELATNLLSQKDKTAEKIYEDNKAKIDRAFENYINASTESFKNLLMQYGIIVKEDADVFTVSNLGFAKTGEMSKEVLDRNLKTLTVNYMIANIEFHKLLYSDPYMYKDELKRIKNFLSPRQAIVSSGNVNTVLERVMNEGYKKGDIGYTDMTQTYFKSTTIADIQGVIDIDKYDAWDEADGAGIIGFKAHRNLRKRANNWSDADEAQYRYDVAWEKQHKSKGLTEKEIEEKGLKLSKAEQRTLDQGNPRVKSAYTDQKPIISGNRADGKSYNDVMLDKLALFPLSYRIAVEMAELAGQKTSNAVRLYNKMQEENIDYAVFKSARKVGGTVTNEIYDEDGVITKEPFKGVITVPFSIISIQTEVPSKEDNLVTRGSQMTKLATMDMMEAGVPIDFMVDEKDFSKKMEAWYKIPSETQKKIESPLYAEIKNNEALLNALTEEGYNIVLKKLGITEKDGELVVTNFSKAAKTLRDEIFRREVNSNIIKTLADFLNGKAILEATPAYQQVRNVLYSIVDKNIASPKMSGGQKVQAPSTFLEDIRATKVKGGYSSDVLKFYEDKNGERYCEIMVGRWFDSPLSDKELMNYFNNTEEGRKELAAMMGVAYRIPTGKQNYIEHYRIKQFLPREMGDKVIVPSALVKKVGSDFDIDKLNVYLKNVYVKNGKPKVIPFFGIGEEARQKLQKTILKEDLESIFKLDQEFPEVYDVSYDSLYKKSLENAYIESLEKLTSHELNFKQLITPNSSDLLKGLSQKITEKLGVTPFESAAIGNILDRGFMSSLRHAFVTGKYAIGIAAVAQTNHSLNQRQPIFVDTRRLRNLTERDRPWVKDGELKFEKFNKVKIGGDLFTSLSGIKDANNKSFISDIIGQFIDGYVDISKGPWIIELGANPNVAGTFLFLAKAGVPIEDVVYFMNQPIVRDYLRSLENAGQSYLFIDDNVDEIKNKYKVAQSQVDKIGKIPAASKLFENIGKTEFSAQEKAEQQFILDEFLKYSKLAEQLLIVQQGTNYDTSTLNDPMLVFKKNELYKRAQTSIISSAEELMKNSFMGKLREFMNKSRDAVSNFLVSDRGRVRATLEDVLAPYVMLSDRDFLSVARKATNTFFDWAVQVSQNRNTFIESLLLSDNNAPSQVLAFKNEIAQDENHPLYNNYIIGKNGILQSITPNKEGGVNNLSVKNKDNKAYDQDQIIYSFRELRDHLDTVGNLQLYKKIVGVSILQSGLSTTPFSFTSLLPYEDFVEIYNDAIYKLEMSSDLDVNKFYELGVFQRNNWADDDIVPKQKAKITGFDYEGNALYNMNMKFGKLPVVQKAINSGDIPRLLKVSTLSNSGRMDFISHSWEQVPEGKSKKQMRKEGDFSYIKKGLFKKVYFDKERTKPVTTSFTMKMADGTTKIFTSYVYQMVNAWGDSFRANELYDVVRESVIDNGYEKVVTGQYQLKGFFMGQDYVTNIQTSPERDDYAVAKLFAAIIESAPTKKQITPEGLPSINDNNTNNCG